MDPESPEAFKDPKPSGSYLHQMDTTNSQFPINPVWQTCVPIYPRLTRPLLKRTVCVASVGRRVLLPLTPRAASLYRSGHRYYLL